jgi:thioredoxin-related protein
MPYFKRLLLIAPALAALLFSNAPFAQSTDDMAQAAQQARSAGMPIMVVFGTEDCGYCERMKSEFLLPQLQQGDLQKKVLIREVDIQAAGKIADFDGLRVRNGLFVHRYEVFATPTVVLVDPEGRILTPPLVGYSDARDYQERLEQAIDTATRSLRPAQS